MWALRRRYCDRAHCLGALDPATALGSGRTQRSGSQTMKHGVQRRGLRRDSQYLLQGSTFFISTEGRDRGNSEPSPRKVKILMGLVGCRGGWVGRRWASHRLRTWGENQETRVALTQEPASSKSSSFFVDTASGGVRREKSISSRKAGILPGRQLRLEETEENSTDGFWRGSSSAYGMLWNKPPNTLLGSNPSLPAS